MPTSVELTQNLVRFRTINPPGDERACAERLASVLGGAGFAVDVVPFGNRRAQLVARIGGTAGKLPLGFTGHLDTVPLGAQPWSVDPFAAEILDGKLYGRGSSDMKSGVAAFVAACISLADKLAGTAGVVLFITAGEETGCAGAADLARTMMPLPQVGGLVVAEQPATMRWSVTRERYGLRRSRPVSPRTAQCPRRASMRFIKRHAPLQPCRISISMWLGTMFLADQPSTSGRCMEDSTSIRCQTAPQSAQSPGKATRKFVISSRVISELKSNCTRVSMRQVSGPTRTIHGSARYSALRALSPASATRLHRRHTSLMRRF